jgi:hypothetical protein
MENIVRLKCVKAGSKLRVRIISPGYNPDANCQFPRAIRVEGREYTAPADAITFSEDRNKKFFYRVKKSAITVVEGAATGAGAVDKVYGDDAIDMDCVVCMAFQKDVVFAPCGHYCCCSTCATTVKTRQGNCPICRGRIQQVVRRDQIA